MKLLLLVLLLASETLATGLSPSDDKEAAHVAAWATVRDGETEKSAATNALRAARSELDQGFALTPPTTFGVPRRGSSFTNLTTLLGRIAFRRDAGALSSLKNGNHKVSSEILALDVERLSVTRIEDKVTLSKGGEFMFFTDILRLPHAGNVASTHLTIDSVLDPRVGVTKLLGFETVSAATAASLKSSETASGIVEISLKHGFVAPGITSPLKAKRRVIPPAAKPQPSQKTVIVNDNDWPPFFFGGKDEGPVGAAKEILSQCFPKTGKPTVFRNFPIKRMRRDMESGVLDINVYSYEKSREDWLLFGKEIIYTAEYRPVVRAGSSIAIKKLEDFDKLKLGHLAGLVYSEEFLDYVKRREAAGTLDVADAEEINLKKLLAGRIDVFVNSTPTVRWLAQQLGAKDQIKVLDYVVKRGDYYVTFSKASKRLSEAEKKKFLGAVDLCLKGLKKDGTYLRIMNAYGQVSASP